MKKIPKVTTRDEISIAFEEGAIAYREGIQSWSNPYILENEELTRAWLDGWLGGWKAASAGDHKRCHNEAPPVEDEN